MIFPDDIEAKAQRLFERHWRQWAVEEALASQAGTTLPADSDASSSLQARCEDAPLMRLGLKPPREADFAQGASLAEAQRWVRAWDRPPHPCRVEWAHRRWVRLGDQRIPVAVEIPCARVVAAWARQTQLWDTALKRLEQLATVTREEHHPLFSHATASLPNAILKAVTRSVGLWAKLSEADWQRGLDVLGWLLRNPEPNCFGRQLPIRGIDTKWLGKSGSSFVDLVRLLTEKPVAFLQQSAPMFRCIAGSPSLAFGAIHDYSLTAHELSRLDQRPRAILICENLVNVLCLRELVAKTTKAAEHTQAPATPCESVEQELACALHDVLIVWGSGYAAGGLGEVAWIDLVPIVYWGDIDTHGFAILNMVRSFARQTQTTMMDTATLLRYQDLCVEEPSPTNAQLPNLTDEEAQTLALLSRSDRHLRLEQERIEWLWACGKLVEALNSAGSVL